MTLKFVRLGACVLLLVALLPGCESLKTETGGEVTIGRPQVFSRERLLQERSEELAWLKEQLARPFESNISGIRDFRRATAIVLELQASVDLAARRQAEIDTQQGAGERARQAEVDDLTHQIRVTELRKELESLKASTTPAPAASAASSATSPDLTKVNDALSQINTKLQAIEEKLKPAMARTKASSLFTGGQERLINPASAERSATEISSRERFEDESAYRDNILARKRDRMLDDTHDHAGSTLYELKFDAAITPGSNTRRKALVEVQIKPDEVKGDQIVTANFLERLLFRVKEDSNLLISRQYDRLKAGKMSGNWRESVLASIRRDDAPGLCNLSLDRQSDLRGGLPFQILRDRLITGSSIGGGRDEQNALKLGSCLIALYAKTRLELALDSYFTFKVSPQRGDDTETFSLLDVGLAHGARARLVAKMDRLRVEQPAWVANVDPKEYVQNVSEVSSDNAVRDIALSLSGSNGKGLSGSANAEYFKQQQELLQTIRRQPLATSFHNENKFGWVLGPRFEIRGSKAVFSQTTARYTFGATVVVPGWLPEMNMKACGYWIESDGSRSSSGNFPMGVNCIDLNHVNLQRTQGYRHLLYALMESHQDVFGSPEISMLPQTNKKGGAVVMLATPLACVVAPDKSCEQSLVIEGRELWRNPEVYVGHQKADRVELLPSMRGVVATFKSLTGPPTVPGAGAQPQDLFVSTSAGQDRLTDAVLIVPSGLVDTKPFARLSAPYLERSGTDAMVIAFLYDQAAFPKAYADVEGRLRVAGSPKWIPLPGDPTYGGGNLSYQVADPTALGLSKQSVDVEVDLVFQLVPGGEWRSVMRPGAGKAVFLASRSEREMIYAPASLADFSKGVEYGDKQRKALQEALQFSIPANSSWFFKAYPGLEDALSERGGSARITLIESDGSAPIVVSVERAKSKGKDVVRAKSSSLAAVDQLIVSKDESSKTFSLGVSYRQGSGDWLPVALQTPSNLTVIGRKKPPAPKKEEESQASAATQPGK